jgi:hypothetical protein
MDHPTQNDRLRLVAMRDIAAEVALLTPGGKRPVHGLDDVAPLPQFAQGRFEPFRERPDPRFGFVREPIAFQLL